MSDTPSIPLDLVSDDRYRDVNPHYVCDGKWGGFGHSYWRYADQFGFARGDVAEWREVYVDNKRVGAEWFRIWIDAENRWRDLTSEEAAKLPAFKPRGPLPDFANIVTFPISASTPEAAEALAALLAQPLSQVLEQAPILQDLFSSK